MDLKASYYRNCILSIHRGLAFGVPSNAKPLFLLSIIKGIEDRVITENKFTYEERLETIYKELCSLYEPNRKPAPFYKPFYHSIRELYYDIKWKGGKIPNHNWHTPSPKFIKENIEYAYLDDGLWDIFQDKSVRSEFCELIVSYYLKTEKQVTYEIQ